MKTILITGAGGQLGRCFKQLAGNYRSLSFVFLDSKQLDISSEGAVDAVFRANDFDYCINCAAYTNVELAEDQTERAYKINARAVGILTRKCNQYGTTLVHFSTDYVFDGTNKFPYTEVDEVNPINVYGASKLEGELQVTDNMERYFIFRTSWLYSDLGHNFFNTIRRKAEEGADLKITTSQTGTPTNAYDLASFVLNIIANDHRTYGIYHYSNLGEASWYEFAAEIIRLSTKEKEVSLEKAGDFPTKARRPRYSVLNKDKALRVFGYPIKHWQESLSDLIFNYT